MTSNNTQLITDNGYAAVEQLSNGAECIRAAIAFWTLPPMNWPNSFITGLQHKSAYLCTDVNAPTSINALTDFKRIGVDVRLHLFSTSGYTEVDDSFGMPTHLMHSKVIIFDYPNNRSSKIWIGSHNATNRALNGTNFECSVVTECDKNTAFYKQVESHLKEIYDATQSFNLAYIQQYKMLQKSKMDNEIHVVEFENSNDVPLRVNEEISLLMLTRSDFDIVNKVGRKVYVSLHGSEELLYEAEILQSGVMPKSKSQYFAARRYSQRKQNGLQVLKIRSEIPEQLYTNEYYFINFKINKQLGSNFQVVDKPQKPEWISLNNLKSTPFERVMQKDEQSDMQSSNLRSTLKIRVPSFSELNEFQAAFKTEDMIHFAFDVISLEEKRNRTRTPIFVKKLLVEKVV